MVMQMPSTIMNAQTVVGPPAQPFYLGGMSYSAFTFYKRVVGVFTALVVNYEGSLDGVNWFQIGTDNTVANGATFVVDRPVIYIRANIGTFTGGTNVSVDVLPFSAV